MPRFDFEGSNQRLAFWRPPDVMIAFPTTMERATRMRQRIAHGTAESFTRGSATQRRVGDDFDRDVVSFVTEQVRHRAQDVAAEFLERFALDPEAIDIGGTRRSKHPLLRRGRPSRLQSAFFPRRLRTAILAWLERDRPKTHTRAQRRDSEAPQVAMRRIQSCQSSP